MRREYRLLLLFFAVSPIIFLFIIWIKDYDYAFKTKDPVYVDFRNLDELNKNDGKYVIITHAELSNEYLKYKKNGTTEEEVYFLIPEGERLRDTVYGFVQLDNKFPSFLFFLKDKFKHDNDAWFEGQLEKGVYLENRGKSFVEEEFGITYRDDESFILIAGRTPSFVAKSIYLWSVLIILVSILVVGVLYRYLSKIEEREKREGRGVSN
jgi:hypothetical protein